MPINIKTMHRVFVVFRLFDDFTGKLLSRADISFFSEDDKRLAPIRKQDGLYVLADIPEPGPSKVVIRSPHYCEQVIDDFSKVTPDNPIITVRLMPGTNYNLLSGTTAYTGRFLHKDGRIAEGLAATLHGPFQEGMVKLRSFETIEGVPRVILTNPYGLDLSGLTLSVPAKAKEKIPVVFTLVNRIDNNTYEIACMPQEAIAGTPAVRRVYASITDTRGWVLIPVDPGKNQTSLEFDLFACESRNTYQRSISLIKGSIQTGDERLNW